jgi:hypothetical protein
MGSLARRQTIWGGGGEKNTGVELLEWESSPAAATPTTFLHMKIRREQDQTNWAVKHNLL